MNNRALNRQPGEHQEVPDTPNPDAPQPEPSRDLREPVPVYDPPPGSDTGTEPAPQREPPALFPEPIPSKLPI